MGAQSHGPKVQKWTTVAGLPPKNGVLKRALPSEGYLPESAFSSSPQRLVIFPWAWNLRKIYGKFTDNPLTPRQEGDKIIVDFEEFEDWP